MAFKILICLPMRSPTRLDQHGPTFHIEVIERGNSDCAPVPVGCFYQDAVEIGERRQLQLRKIPPVLIPVKRTIEISSCIRHHLDLADVKFCAGRVILARLLTAEIITDDWRRQAFISNQAVLERVTEIDESAPGHLSSDSGKDILAK